MPSFEERALLSFREELSKIADVPWQLLGRAAGSGMGIGAGVLGAGMAARGAARGWRDAREQGEGVGGAAMHALGTGAKSGLSGAALGALGGAAAGGVGALARPELTARAIGSLENAHGSLGAMSRFGQRQVHSLTGWTPEEGLGAIRGGAFGQRQSAENAANAVEEAFHSGDRGKLQGAMRGAEKAYAARDAAQAVEDRGMTSVPGSLRALRSDPLGALSAGAKQQWHGSSKAEKALLVGLPAAQLGMAAAGHDQNKGERIGENLGGLVGGLAFGGAPLAGQLAGGIGAGLAGKFLGKGIDRMRSREGVVNRQPELEPVNNEAHVPTERNMSASAQGLAPEGIG